MPPPLSRSVLGGLGLYLGVSGTTYWYFKGRRSDSAEEPRQGPDGTVWPEGVSGAAYDNLADSYDQQIEWDETLMGINLLRWWVVRKAKGSTLEVSAGTGRNLPYYSFSNLTSLTLVDTSRNMLEHAHDKLANLPAVAKSLDVHVCQGRAEELCQCAHQDAVGHATPARSGCNIPACPAPFPSGEYDTVIDTFGLCSHDDPVKVLKEMGRACKPGGQILLIEHGRSDWEWVNKQLDSQAEKHFQRWGCWWNRDIAHLVATAGLHVVSTHRWHFGTTYVIYATVPDCPRSSSSFA